MKWVITEDQIDNGASVGKGTFKGEANTLPHVFRLLDDDGEVYYHGRSNDNNSESAFQPLDWATANAGCTEIQYRRAGKWETL